MWHSESLEDNPAWKERRLRQLMLEMMHCAPNSCLQFLAEIGSFISMIDMYSIVPQLVVSLLLDNEALDHRPGRQLLELSKVMLNFVKFATCALCLVTLLPTLKPCNSTICKFNSFLVEISLFFCCG